MVQWGIEEEVINFIQQIKEGFLEEIVFDFLCLFYKYLLVVNYVVCKMIGVKIIMLRRVMFLFL